MYIFYVINYDLPFLAVKSYLLGRGQWALEGTSDVVLKIPFCYAPKAGLEVTN